MDENRHLLIVAGGGRNVGKTELVCRLIEKFRVQTNIYALKVSAVFPDEAMYHGQHGDVEQTGRLFEERRRDTDKDTARMLKAGACRVFYLAGETSEIIGGYREFIDMIPQGGVVVCESNSLRDLVEPGLLVLVRSADGDIKPRARALLSLCDLELISDGRSGFPALADITLSSELGWRLKRI